MEQQQGKRIMDMEVAELKHHFPIFPNVKIDYKGNDFRFYTLLRKKIEGSYYIIPVVREYLHEGALVNEQIFQMTASLYSVVYRTLVLSKYNNEVKVLDDNQEFEMDRLIDGSEDLRLLYNRPILNESN